MRVSLLHKETWNGDSGAYGLILTIISCHTYTCYLRTIYVNRASEMGGAIISPLLRTPASHLRTA